MCGIVGIGNSWARMADTHLKFFESLLHADVVRGHHATGVYRDDADGGTILHKRAIPSPEYLTTEGWENLKGKDLTKYQVDQLVKDKKPVPLPVSSFYVGHNRWATIGKSDDDDNAHPFKCGNITLVHNGTLRGQWRLPDHKDFAVDSHNIAHAIDKEGIEETIKKLQGAYTLVWHDANTNTLNFLRNSERPLYMMKFTSGMWAWASEKEMIKWLNNRRKAPFTISEEFELPVGEQIIFDVSKGKFELKERVQHKLPTFPVTQTNYGRNWYDDDHYLGKRYGATQQTVASHARSHASSAVQNAVHSNDTKDALVNRTNRIFAANDLDIAHGQTLEFYPYEFTPYSSESPTGRVRGYALSDDGGYLEAECHGVSREDFKGIDGQATYGKIRSAFVEKAPLDNGRICENVVAIMQDISLEEPDDNQLDSADELVQVDVPFISSSMQSLVDEGVNDEADNGFVPFSTQAEADAAMAEANEDLGEVKHSSDGEKLYKNTWKFHKLSTCGFCGNSIPWAEADETETVAGIVACCSCYNSLLVDRG